jgi:transposase-like protein
MTVEVARQVKKRQKRSVEEKRRIVEETLAAGASVARVAAGALHNREGVQ